MWCPVKKKYMASDRNRLHQLLYRRDVLTRSAQLKDKFIFSTGHVNLGQFPNETFRDNVRKEIKTHLVPILQSIMNCHIHNVTEDITRERVHRLLKFLELSDKDLMKLVIRAYFSMKWMNVNTILKLFEILQYDPTTVRDILVQQHYNPRLTGLSSSSRGGSLSSRGGSLSSRGGSRGGSSSSRGGSRG